MVVQDDKSYHLHKCQKVGHPPQQAFYLHKYKHNLSQNNDTNEHTYLAITSHDKGHISNLIIYKHRTKIVS